jgi:7,8-dihydropterin-6-yl-methyl-4-(beta-D-ribofuranosyl)aminobenzene 5'-phosphate synthase
MRILVLSDDETSSDKLRTEHGLSLYIEIENDAGVVTPVLFGFGAGDTFIKNAHKLKAELAGVAGVLPHGHLSVAGGLEPLLKIFPRTRVFAQNTAGGEFYKYKGAFRSADCLSRHSFDKIRNNLIMFPKFQQIHERIYAVQPQKYFPFPDEDRCCVKVREGYTADDFSHEIVLAAFPTGKRRDGCVILTSCTHRGIQNTIATVNGLWEDAPVISVVGGLHFSGGNGMKKVLQHSSDIDSAADFMLSHISGLAYVCHCGGGKGYARFEERMNGRCERLKVGEELTF